MLSTQTANHFRAGASGFAGALGTQRLTSDLAGSQALGLYGLIVGLVVVRSSDGVGLESP